MTLTVFGICSIFFVVFAVVFLFIYKASVLQEDFNNFVLLSVDKTLHGIAKYSGPLHFSIPLQSLNQFNFIYIYIYRYKDSINIA